MSDPDSKPNNKNYVAPLAALGVGAIRSFHGYLAAPQM